MNQSFNLDIPVENYQMINSNPALITCSSNMHSSTMSPIPSKHFKSRSQLNLDESAVWNDDLSNLDIFKNLFCSEVRRSFNILSDVKPNKKSSVYPSTSFSHARSTHSSFLKIPSTTNDSKLPLSHFEQDLFHRPSVGGYSNEFDSSKAKALLVASARQSRTVLTDLPVDFFPNFSESYSWFDQHLKLGSNQPLYSSADQCTTRKSMGTSCTKRLSSMPLQGLDGSTTTEDSTGHMVYPYLNASTTDLKTQFGPNRSNAVTNTDFKSNEKSFIHIAKNTSQAIIHKPFKRLAASFRLTKTRSNNQNLIFKNSNFSNSVKNLNYDLIELNKFNNKLTRNVILQTDQDFLYEMKRDAGLRKGYLLNKFQSLDNNESDSLWINDDRMGMNGSASYLKEQFFAFFQPAGNKLAMKLFGTKVALDREKLRQEQQGRWIIHPCSNFRQA